MKKLKGKITISRPTSTHRDPYVSITVIDAESGTEAVEVQMDLASFAEALTGMGRTECEFSWNDSGRIGKIREIKQVPVFVPDGPWDDRRDDAARALAVHEVDGWHGSVSDATNHHRSMQREASGGKQGSWQSVGFERWVDPPTEPAE